jgi:hypothetical protein
VQTIFEWILGDSDPNTAQAILNLARVHISLGRYKEAEILFLHALRFFNEKDASDSSAGLP